MKLPSVLSTGPMELTIAAIISLVVDLPLLPVIATQGTANRLRHQDARSPSALSVLPTRMTATSRGTSTFEETTTIGAPFATASPTKACPSKWSPRMATNSCPRSIARVSMHTPEQVEDEPACRTSPFVAASTSSIVMVIADILPRPPYHQNAVAPCRVSGSPRVLCPPRR